ncbi:MAG TPA: M28 family peptidase [Vicinamibacterales bacterium]|nr:M28 family peptidase [Vicinamibacterales bacterium]
MSHRILVCALAVLVASAVQPWRLLAQAPSAVKGVKFPQISEADMREWLTYLASDELQGRQIYTEGYGAAAQYIADHLKSWGVKPIGDNGSYFQVVKMKGYRVTNNSSITIAGPEGTKTFKHGDHVTFATNAGKKQTLTFDGVQFLGSTAPAAGTNLAGKLAVWMTSAPAAPAAGGRAAGAAGGRGGGGRVGGAAVQAGAAAAVGFTAAPPSPSPAEQQLVAAQAALDQAAAAVQQALTAVRGRGAANAGRGAGGGRGATTGCQNCDIAPTPRAVDNIVTPQFTGDETLFDALFSGGPVKFADVRAKADRGEPLTPMALSAKVTVTIDNTYDVVYEQLSRNVVGMIEGSDPKLKDTYVLYGAHLDHVGYSMTGGGSQPSNQGCRNRSEAALAGLAKLGKTPVKAPRGGGAGAGAAAGGGRAAGAPGAAGAGAGRAQAGAAPAAGQPQPAAPKPFDERDFISNGADDDGSGSITELAVAKAFATGPRPKRSIVFIWHAGEEAGLLGSVYNADHPIVPLDKIQAQLNMDMVGRDDCNNLEGDYTNSVFLVGDDRISTDLHNLIIETNQTLAKPLVLDYEMNDPADPEGVYTRSDHYSYAAKGIPIAFFTTGLHPDYHRVTDTVEKITFPKMARIGQLMYQTGYNIAATDKVLERDNKGPRAGYGTPMTIIKK